MRRILFWSVLLLGVGPVLGAPRPISPPSLGPSSPEFAVQLYNVVQQVNQQYIRPVPEPELLKAALAGLYEAARMTVPADLTERIDKAAARHDLISVIQETHSRTAAALTALRRDPMTVACQALFRSLDPYSGVISKEDQQRNVALDQTAQGVGIDLEEYTGSGPLVVKTVFPGGAAQRAGIRPGDRITHIRGTAVEKNGIGPEQMTGLRRILLESPPSISGSPVPFDPLTGEQLGDFAAGSVKVTFRGSGGWPRTVELDRMPFRVETVLGTGRDDGHHWHYWADYKKRIAHVRVSMLAKGTGDELASVLDQLQRQEVRGLILDLRWTPGGYLTDSTFVAGLFLGNVTVATVKYRTQNDDVFRGGGESALLDLPMVVLVNGETSGGAELIAAALQDHKRAVVVGQRTLGKASVQQPLQNPPPGVQLKLTAGTFYRPSGKNLHRFPESKPGDDWGVKPDVEFRVSPQLGRQLKAWWEAQTLRPGPSLERLPLDDLSNDAQLRAAVDTVAANLEKR